MNFLHCLKPFKVVMSVFHLGEHKITTLTWYTVYIFDVATLQFLQFWASYQSLFQTETF